MYLSNICMCVYMYMCVFLMYLSLLECKLHRSRYIVLLCIAISQHLE